MQSLKHVNSLFTYQLSGELSRNEMPTLRQKADRETARSYFW